MVGRERERGEWLGAQRGERESERAVCVLRFVWRAVRRRQTARARPPKRVGRRMSEQKEALFPPLK
jgi:hypothetical protein